MSRRHDPGKILFVLLLACALCAAPRGAAAESELRYLDSAQWTFNEDCAARGDTIVTTLAYGAQIWDAVDKENIHMLSDIYNEGQKTISIDLCDNIMAFTTANGRLKVFDIGDPRDPELVNELTGFGINADVAFRKRGAARLCFVAGSAGLKVVDLTNPATGGVVGELDLFGDPVSMDFFGAYDDSLVVLSDNYGVLIVDAADPYDPSLVGSIANEDNYLYNITTNGEIAVVATRLNGLFIYDITSPTMPNLLLNYAVEYAGDTYYCKDALLDGDTMYVAVDQSGVVNTEQAGIRVYDMTLPLTPVLLGYDDAFYETINNISMADGKIYMTQWGWIKDGIHIIDVGDPSDPHSLGHTQAWDFTRYAAVENDRIYTPMGHMGCFVHTFDTPDVGGGAGFTEGGGYFALNAWHIEMVDGTAHIASADDGYVIVDWPDAGDGTLIGQISPYTNVCRDVLVFDDVSFLAVYRSGLVSVDISDPAAPAEIDEAGALLSGGDHEAIAIDIQGDLAAVAERIQGLQLYRVNTDTGDIIEHLGQWVPGVRVVDVLLHGDYAYVCCNGYTLRVLDISDPTVPTEVKSISVESLSCFIERDFLHLAAGGSGLVTYSIADPADPVELCRFNTTHEAQSVFVDDEIAYVSDYSALLALRFVQDIPAELNLFTLGWDGRIVELAWTMADAIADEDLRLVAERFDQAGGETEIPFLRTGALSFRAVDDRAALIPGTSWRYTLYTRDPGGPWDAVTTRVVDLDASLAGRLALTNFPNPFNPTTMLRIRAEEAGRGRLDIFDLQGRRVRTLFEGPFDAGTLEVEWDGRDDAGRDLAGGLYFASLATETERVNRRLVMIR